MKKTCLTILFTISATNLFAGPYTADIEPYGLVNADDYFFPYLPSVIAAAVVTFYLGLKGFLNAPRNILRSWCIRGFRALDTQGHTFWLIDKAVAFILLVIALFPFLLFPLAMVFINDIKDIAISGALEGVLVSFGGITALSDKALENMRETLNMS